MTGTVNVMHHSLKQAYRLFIFVPSWLTSGSRRDTWVRGPVEGKLQAIMLG